MRPVPSALMMNTSFCPSTVAVNAMYLLSGDHTAPTGSSPLSRKTRTLPPSGSALYSAVRPLRLDWNSSTLPSGLSAG